MKTPEGWDSRKCELALISCIIKVMDNPYKLVEPQDVWMIQCKHRTDLNCNNLSPVNCMMSFEICAA
jgi:hypothetical protein